MNIENKYNFVFLILLAFFITIGCNLNELASESETPKNSNKSSESNSSDDDELLLTMVDEDSDSSTDEDSNSSTEDETKKAKTDNSTQTVVKFDKGKTSKGYKNAVIRGEKHTYILGASSNQEMSVNINSLEDNAVFRIISPNGKYTAGSEEDGAKEYNEILDESGKYKIVITPTRGNATYNINFTVSAKEKVDAPPSSGGGGLTKTVKFGKGKSSASYSGAVIRAESDSYILGASGGQMMNVSISSLEANAVFDIISPDGSSIATEKTSWSGQLPQDGKYRIVVGGTRGNATYKINFAVR